MEMKKILIILILNFYICSEKVEFNVSMYGLPMANVSIKFDDILFDNKNAIKLSFNTHTNKIASKIFNVNNSYITVIEKKTYDILSYEKKTIQPGLENIIKTNLDNGQVRYLNGEYIIPKNYFNIFSLLYYLSKTSYNQVKEKVKLEREGLIYDCLIKKEVEDTNYIYNLEFIKIDNQNIPVIENTDIFTWAVFKDNSKKSIIVNKDSLSITSCNFKIGLTNVKAKKMNVKEKGLF